MKRVRVGATVVHGGGSHHEAPLTRRAKRSGDLWGASLHASPPRGYGASGRGRCSQSGSQLRKSHYQVAAAHTAAHTDTPGPRTTQAVLYYRWRPPSSRGTPARWATEATLTKALPIHLPWHMTPATNKAVKCPETYFSLHRLQAHRGLPWWRCSGLESHRRRTRQANKNMSPARDGTCCYILYCARLVRGLRDASKFPNKCSSLQGEERSIPGGAAFPRGRHRCPCTLGRHHE